MSNNEKKLAEEISKECLVVRVKLLNRTISALYDEALRPLGIKSAQMNVLTVVAKRGPISPKQIGEILIMEKSTVSRSIERLEKNAWLSVFEGETGRDHLLELTDEGKKLLRKAKPLWESAQENAKKILGKEGSLSILKSADKVWDKARTN